MYGLVDAMRITHSVLFFFMHVNGNEHSYYNKHVSILCPVAILDGMFVSRAIFVRFLTL